MSDRSKLITFVSVAIALLLLGAAGTAFNAIKMNESIRQERYDAWVKLTGNPKHLSKDEFNSLADARIIK